MDELENDVYPDWNSDAADSGDDYDGDNTEGEGQKQHVDADFVRKEVEAAIEAMADAIERGDANSKVYKTLQRRLSAKDVENRELREALAKQEAALAELADQLMALGEATEWSGNTLLDALDEEARTKALMALTEKRVKLVEARAQRASNRQPSPVQRPTGTPGVADDDLRARMAERNKQFIANRTKYAVELGLDPQADGLDFGREDQSFEDRLVTFEASVQKALKAKAEKAAESVRPKSNRPATRAGSGNGAGDAAFPAHGGMDALERAARARLMKMR